MKRHPAKLLLAPFALLYGIGVGIRNWAYSLGLLESKSFDIPIVCVGNLSVGGTGKTPHTEYFIRLLKDHVNVATLSRGYGRKTSGFLLASINSVYTDIGDEPKQFKCKFPEIPVAVDEKRKHGIEKLLEKHPETDLVLLDDAFQHRAVKPEFSILITPYSDLFINDFLLPVGRLREWKSGYKRADIIIVSKCPDILSPLDRRAIKADLKPLSYQNVYFSFLKYGRLTSCQTGNQGPMLTNERKIYLFTGIANNGPLLDHLNVNNVSYEHKSFPDHHDYSADDIAGIVNEFNTMNLTNDSLLVTTEKDFMRLRDTSLLDAFKGLSFFYLPISVEFHGTDGSDLDAQILDYVRKNQIHRNVSQNQDTDKA